MWSRNLQITLHCDIFVTIINADIIPLSKCQHWNQIYVWFLCSRGNKIVL